MSVIKYFGSLCSSRAFLDVDVKGSRHTGGEGRYFGKYTWSAFPEQEADHRFHTVRVQKEERYKVLLNSRGASSLQAGVSSVTAKLIGCWLQR